MTSQQVTNPSATASLKRRLGRGLGSLISSPVQVEALAPRARESAHSPAPRTVHAAERPAETPPLNHGHAQSLAIDQLKPNPKQPRQHFDDAALAALASSITTTGMMQPIVVRPSRSGGFEIIAGERRWRAAQMAGLARMDVVVRDVDDRTAAQFSLVENLQREDLNPIERAEAFRRLIQEFSLTHQEIAETVGLDRTSITNHLRLNELDDATKDALRGGELTLGHAKALLAITNNERRRALAVQALKGAWSVRETERRVRAMIEGESAGSKTRSRAASMPPYMADLEKRLGEHLGTKVRIETSREKGRGRLIIEFFSIDQFEGLLERLQFQAD